jgi:hypothetical protein
VPCPINRRGAEPFPARRVEKAKEMVMDERDKALPSKDRKEIEREAEKSRKALESVPEHGTDPLHEGP